MVVEYRPAAARGTELLSSVERPAALCTFADVQDAHLPGNLASHRAEATMVRCYIKARDPLWSRGPDLEW